MQTDVYIDQTDIDQHADIDQQTYYRSTDIDQTARHID